MARVTHDEVNDLIATGDKDTTPFIETATNFITDELGSSGLSEARLRSIELWLSAHYTALSIEKGGLKSQTIDDVKEVYAVQDGVGLGGTRYGQTAMSLDTTGILRSLGGKGAARFTVVGDGSNSA